MESGVPVGVVEEAWTPAGGVAAAVAEPGLEGAPSVDIPSLSSSGPRRGSPTRWTFYNIHFMEVEKNRENSRRGAAEAGSRLLRGGGLLAGGLVGPQAFHEVPDLEDH